MCAGVVGFLRGADIEGGGNREAGSDGFGGLDVLLLHPKMAFAGG